MSDRDNKLPEPFDNLAVDGEVTSERYGGKESLTPGTRVVKGPGYDQGKLTAVEGNYIGTILRVDFEENAKPVLCAFTTKSEKKKEKRAVRAPSEGAEAFKTRFHIQEYREEKGINFVEVYWDNGKKEYCVIGPDTFELQLYECNFIREDDMQCDGCKEYPLHGIRWSCITCNATNLCTSCYMTDKEISNHIYKRLITKGLNGLDMPSRSQSAKNGKRKEVRGIIVGSKVDLHKENTQGTVVGFVKGNVYRYIFQDAENPDNEIDSKTIMKNYKDSKAIKIRLPERMPNDILPPLTRDMIEKLPEIRVIMQLEGKEYVAGTVVSYKEIDDDVIILFTKP
ncbi:uncharacterized protein LOC133198250 [Saccostrea echinata]|uniref:uncharacterized protein LOC133198250 n=1 Tax=Saccostrea echinata TaxID=191078 RepID=UPI002A812C73|nr:uncharacterized protein LOC133198250 [Saccostrea echinata]